MMSHLFGRAVLDQGPDHQLFLVLVFSQTEAKTYMILKEEMKSRQNAPYKSRNKEKLSQNISKNLRQDDVLDVGGACRIRL